MFKKQNKKTKQEARVTNWVFKCQKGLLEEHTKSFMCIKMLCNLKKDWVTWRPSKLDSSILFTLGVASHQYSCRYNTYFIHIYK